MKYKITLTEIEKYVVNVEAESEDAAKDMAWAVLEDNGRYIYYVDSDDKAEVTEVSE